MKATSSLFDPSVCLQIWLSKHFGRENFKPHRMRCRFHRFGNIHYLIRTMQVNGNESIESTENVCQVSIKQISMLDRFNSINIGIVTFHVRICVVQEEAVKLYVVLTYQTVYKKITLPSRNIGGQKTVRRVTNTKLS